MKAYFLTQVKKNLDNVYDKGVVVKETLDSAKQSMHAYFGAYGYGHDTNIDFTMCVISDSDGNILHTEVDNRTPADPKPDKNYGTGSEV